MKVRHFLGLAAVALVLTAAAQTPSAWNPGIPWPATDALGRRTPVGAEAGALREDRFAGIFYFLWSGQHETGASGPFLISDILKRFPDALSNASSPPWGPAGAHYYWGEPLFGFYLADDPWLLRRHAMLLADAGIDTLIFDTTNRITYRDVYFRLCEVFREIRREGGRTPQIAFMVNTEAGATAQELYQDLYQPGRYEELWFRWQGKPLLIADPEKVSAEVKAFFTLRTAHWPFTQVNTQNAWHWEAAYPQVFGFTDDPKRPEQVNVSVAQNLRMRDGVVVDMSSGEARGRSYHNDAEDTSPGAVNYGYNFQEQWNRALNLAPPFVMVTGWNEWTAGRFSRAGKPVVFVDQFDEEHSRDIEMMKGGHLDNYYYQLVSNVRSYKGVAVLPAASGQKTIPLDDGYAAWREVRPEYVDHIGETAPRDFDGIGRLHYTTERGANDLELMKVARDRENVYFYARTMQDIVRPGDGRMMLLIAQDGSEGPYWEGYRYAVNRVAARKDTAVLERSSGGWNWEKVADVAMRVRGRELYFAIPRSALGVGTGDFGLDFKWVDSVQSPGDIMDFYVSGDVAPEGRFRYRYMTKQ